MLITAKVYKIKYYISAPAILILEPFAFEVKKVIVFINVISMGYASRNSIKNHN